MTKSSFLVLWLVAAMGCSAEKDPVSPVIEPTCGNPAPLHLVPEAVAVPNEYIVIYADDIADAESVTLALMKKYRFNTKSRWSGPLGIRGFSARLDGIRVAALRCEPVVKYIEQNQYLYLN